MNNDGASLVPTRPVIDAKIAAEQLHVSLSMIYKLIRQRQLEGYTVGRCKLIFADSIEAYRLRQAFGPAPMKPVPAVEVLPRGRRKKDKVMPLDLPILRHLR